LYSVANGLPPLQHLRKELCYCGGIGRSVCRGNWSQ